MEKAQNDKQKEYKQMLKAFHQQSDRHVLVLETDLSYQDRCRVFHAADLERKAGNELVSVMRRNYEQLIRTKRYRKLKALYKAYADFGDKKNCKRIAEQMNEMQKQHHVTWDFCRKTMIPIGKKYGIDAVFALTKAEDIWKGMEKCLYSDGRMVHFSKREELPVIRAKQPNRGIILSAAEDQLRFKFQGLSFGVQLKDRFAKEEAAAILNYLSQPDVWDRAAIDTLQTEGICISTYRPCYASLVCKKIRGKLRVYVHITLEGLAKPKYDSQGNLKHRKGRGVIGCDIGTQTIAYTSEREVGLKNLAERGSSISVNERKERRIYRALDRSRRALNPRNYNPDGTVKKGHKVWKVSNRYRRLKAKHSELCRINAVNRHLAINEDVNHIRSLGNVFVTEAKNAKKLQRRARNTTFDKNGKINRRKRFGRSVKNRCCGYFQAQIERKFRTTNGIYMEVSKDYRASQYDHTADTYIKKKLSDRMYRLSDHTLVQRDWYSSYLLFCIDLTNGTIDKEKCRERFEMQYQREQEMIEWIRNNKIKILNSGIKISNS